MPDLKTDLDDLPQDLSVSYARNRAAQDAEAALDWLNSVAVPAGQAQAAPVSGATDLASLRAEVEGAPGPRPDPNLRPGGAMMRGFDIDPRQVLRGVAELPAQAVGGAGDAAASVMEGVSDAARAVAALPAVQQTWDVTGPIGAASELLADVGPRLLDELARRARGIGGEPRTPVGAGMRSLSQFMTGFLPAFKAMQAAKLAPIASGFAAGAVADFAVFTGMEGNLVNALTALGVDTGLVNDWLAADPSNTEIGNRFRNAVVGALAGGALEGFTRPLLAASRVIRAAKRSAAGVGEVGEAGAEAADAALAKSVDADLQAAAYGRVEKHDFLLIGDPELPLWRRGAQPVTSADPGAKMVAAEMRSSPAAVLAALKAKRPDVEDPLATAIRIAGQAPAEGVRLAKFLADLELATGTGGTRRGLADAGGELAAMDADKWHVGKPGQRRLVVEGGNSLDDAALAAWEAGYFEGTRFGRPAAGDVAGEFGERPSGNDLLDLLREDLQGGGVTGGMPEEDMLVRAEAEATVAWLERHGIDTAQPIERIRAQLDEAEREAAGLERPPADGEPIDEADLQAAGYAEVDPMAGEPAGIQQGKIYVNFGRVQTADDVRELIRITTDSNAGVIDEARRGVQRNAETEKLADQMGMTVEQLLQRRRGQPLNAEEALAARRLHAASAKKLLALANKAIGAGASDVDKYNFRRMLIIHSAIEAEVVAARTETARALQSWSIPAGGGVAQARQISNLLRDAGGPDLAEDLARRLVIMERENPAGVPDLLRASAQARTVDRVREVWINGLLSSPKTHIVNTLSNTLVAVQQVAERLGAEQVARLDRALGGLGDDAVAPGEAAAYLYGMVMSTREAWQMTAKAFRTGEQMIAGSKMETHVDMALSAQQRGLAEGSPAAVSADFLAGALNLPSRLLMSEDNWFKTWAYRGELHARAVRRATAEGLRGADLQRRVVDLVADPPEDLKIAALDQALLATFTNRTGGFGEKVIQLRNVGGSYNPLWLVLPFVRTPINLARYGLERTPFAPLVGQWRADMAAGGARRQLAMTRTALGTMAMLTALDYADRGLVSGAGPIEGPEKEALLRQGWQPWSVKVGDRWYSYNRTDPLGMTLGMAATLAEAVHRADIDPESVDQWHEQAAVAIMMLQSTVTDKTWLKGWSDFNDMMSDPKRYAQRQILSTVGSAMPYSSLLRTIESAGDPTWRQADTPVDAFRQNLLGLSKDLPARRDLWGRPIAFDSGSKAMNFFSPITVSRIEDSPIDAELQRLGYYPARAGRKTSIDGVAVDFREFPKAFERYQELAGNALKDEGLGGGLKDVLDKVVSGKHWLSPIYQGLSDGPDGGKAAWLAEMITTFRARARRQVMIEFPAFGAYVREQRARAPGRFAAPALPPGGPGLPERTIGGGVR